MVAEAAFHSIHGGFRKTAAMIAYRLLPSFAALAADCPNCQVASHRAAAGIAVSSDLRITLRGDNCLHPSFLQRFVNLPFIIGAVAVKRLRPAGHLIQQVVHLAGVIATVFRKGFRFDFVRIWIDRQMQLPPDSTFRLAVFTHFPLAFAENLQSSAIYNHVDRSAVFPNVQRHAHLRRPLGQRCVIRDVNDYFHQFGKRFSQSFCLAIWQLKKLSQNEQTLDCRVAVDKRVPDFRLFVGMMPFCNRLDRKSVV